MKTKIVTLTVLLIASAGLQAKRVRHIKDGLNANCMLIENHVSCPGQTFMPSFGHEFTQWQLKKSNFKNAKFMGTGWGKSSEINFAQSKLNGADFSGATLNYVNFKGATLNKAKFADGTSETAVGFSHVEEGANASFEKAKFENVNFSHSNFQSSNFKDLTAKLFDGHDGEFYDSDFTNAKIEDARFNSAKMYEAVFNSAVIKKADFTEAILHGAKFRCVKFTEDAKFAESDLSGVDFSGADLSRTDLKTADLDRSGASYCDTIMPDGHTYWMESEHCQKDASFNRSLCNE